ncbi:hypothetical protein OF83DRAFT_1097086 [Amylostereum chailletii]|nr:hypothetical protein OF83DRAFT_1097086 [Amylostereum chailletii]
MLCQARAQHLLSSVSPRPVSNPLIATPLDPSALVPVLTQVLDSLDKLCTDASPQPSLRTQILRDRAQALRDCIVLNTLWQMDKLVETTSLSTSSPPTLASGSTSSSALSVQPRPTQAERIRRLARKDTLYHLCTILSLYLRRPVSLVPRQSTFDLREEIGRTLGPFVRKHLTTRRPDHRFDGPTLDEVEQGMIMTVLEHAWAVGVRMGGEDWEGDNHGPSVGAQRADTNADVDVMMEDGSQTT